MRATTALVKLFLTPRVRKVAGGLASAGIVAMLVATVASTASTGCMTNQCNSSNATFSGGEIVESGSAVFYETSPYDGTWIPYPGQVTLRVDLPKGNTRPVVLVAAEMATARNYPDCSSLAVMTTNAGQEFNLLQVDQTGFTANNDGCADYCARFVVTLGDSDGGAADGLDGEGEDGGRD